MSFAYLQFSQSFPLPSNFTNTTGTTFQRFFHHEFRWRVFNNKTYEKLTCIILPLSPGKTPKSFTDSLIFLWNSWSRTSFFSSNTLHPAGHCCWRVFLLHGNLKCSEIRGKLPDQKNATYLWDTIIIKHNNIISLK